MLELFCCPWTNQTNPVKGLASILDPHVHIIQRQAIHWSFCDLKFYVKPDPRDFQLII